MEHLSSDLLVGFLLGVVVALILVWLIIELSVVDRVAGPAFLNKKKPALRHVHHWRTQSVEHTAGKRVRVQVCREHDEPEIQRLEDDEVIASG